VETYCAFKLGRVVTKEAHEAVKQKIERLATPHLWQFEGFYHDLASQLKEMCEEDFLVK
jgi:alpha-beta hydrolase superfamily lysophospholipase